MIMVMMMMMMRMMMMMMMMMIKRWLCCYMRVMIVGEHCRTDGSDDDHKHED